MKVRMQKRLVCLTVIVAMMVSFMPPLKAEAARTVAKVGSKSYTSIYSAVKAAGSGKTIRLMGNVTLSRNLEFSKKGTYTLDLNNHRIKGDFCADVRITKGNVTFKRGTIIAPIRVSDKAKLTILSGTYKRNATDNGNILLDCHDGGKLNIKGGRFDGANAVQSKGIAWIQGGTFSASHWAACAFDADNTATVTVGSGTFKDHFSSSGKTTINGGKFLDGISNNGAMVIKKATVRGILSNWRGGKMTIKSGTFHNDGVEHDYNVNGTAHTTVDLYGGKMIIEGGKFTSKYNSVIGLNVTVPQGRQKVDYPTLIVKGGTIATKCPYCWPILISPGLKGKIKIKVDMKKVFPGKTRESVIKYFGT